MPRVVHFEIPADNPERAQQFYGEIFGWQFQKFGDHPYWLVITGPEGTRGINGGLMLKKPGQPVVNSIEVPSVDDYIATVEARGGKNVVPKMTIPGVGYAAYCTDTEGNIFGLYQEDPGAK